MNEIHTKSKQEKYILGLNYIGHDASASLLKGGQIIASAMEERFTREKHCRDFPINALTYCLHEADITIDDVKVITYYMDPVEFYKQRVIHHLGRFYPRSVPIFDDMLNRALKVKNVEKEIRTKLNFFKEIYFTDHHLAHLSSAFFLSPFKESAAISVDGLGEISSMVIADIENYKINILKRIDYPHSLGMLYNAITHYLGFNAVYDAGKVMGLTGYGDASVFIEEFKKIVRLKGDGGFDLDLSYFEFPFQRDVWISEKFIQIFGPKRKPYSLIQKRHYDIAAALQCILEETLFHIARYAKHATGKDYLCLSGGVALNSVANGKLLQENYFKDIFIPPPTGDDGTSIGGPLYYNYCILNNRKRYLLESAFLGPGYSDDEIILALQRFNLKYYKSDDVCKETAKMIMNNKIVGWFQGRMEVGPRALGNRSILANPALSDIKDILNSKVKFREPFRPFAPSILEEYVKEWFVYDHPAPYMLFVFDIKKEKQRFIPGVKHVDGSGRLQTVDKKRNPKYYQLITEFNRITGIPMIINTSFNIKGEPIVNTPKDAIRCFLGNGLDFLIMNNFVIKK
ncbi:carbamoyltransferase C-terminal domain-containing protein [Desulfococcaceae bacterium HSG7]|nr:carbamoyltransferase C-terminal domain-containing protein [Desulfococcaceae bacterium HSG7]